MMLDFPEFKDRIADHFKKNLPFVAYSLPESEEVSALLQHDNNLFEQSQLREAGFVMASFDSSRKSFIIPKNSSETLHSSIGGQEHAFGNSIQIKLGSNLNDDRIDYLRLVKNAIDQIRSTTLSKVVLSRRQEYYLHDGDAMSILPNLLQRYPAAFVYQFYHPEIGHWFGASPEQFLKLDGTGYHTVSLAGTKAVIEGEDPKWTTKEIDEQAIVTDYISDIMRRFSESVKVETTSNKRAGNLWHLFTPINGTLKIDTDLNQIIENLHPTPAVCGFPKNLAQRFILENEIYDRQFYSGYMGLIDPENSSLDLFVNLRCMHLKNEKMKVYVGGGITSESIPEEEWIETVEKAKTMCGIFEDYPKNE